MPSEKAIELAAQAWCQKETSGIEMDSRLAMAFACIIDRVALQETRSGGERTTNSAMVPCKFHNTSGGCPQGVKYCYSSGPCLIEAAQHQ